MEDFCESEFTDRAKTGIPFEGDTLVDHIQSLSVDTLKDQFELLGSISNFHWWAPVNQFGKHLSSNTQPRYIQHVLFFPEHRDFLPVSPRNIIMNNLSCVNSIHLPGPHLLIGDGQKRLVFNLMHMVHYDQGQSKSVLHNKKSSPPSFPLQPQSTNGVRDGPPPTKKRRYATRVLSADPKSLLEDADLSGVDGLVALESAVTQRTQFELFTEFMHCDGFIQWRKHSEEEDVVVMNNYCSTSGKFLPLEYVHVTATKTDSEDLLIKCTCRIYETMKESALPAQLQENEDAVLPENFTCMHCRFYRTYLQPIKASLHSQDCINKLHMKIQQTLGDLNFPVALIGEAS